jgi:hypothetical protein
VGALAVTVVLALGTLAGRAGAGSPASPPRRVVHVVRPGETVWAIARGLVGSEGDPRPMVDALIGVNHLDAGAMLVGQRLIVPIP